MFNESTPTGLQRIVITDELRDASTVPISFNETDIQLLRGSGLGVFKDSGDLSQLSPMVTQAGNYANFTDETSTLIHNLAARLEKAWGFVQESLAEMAMKGK